MTKNTPYNAKRFSEAHLTMNKILSSPYLSQEGKLKALGELDADIYFSRKINANEFRQVINLN